MKPPAKPKRHYSKRDEGVVGRCTENARCKKHPKHLQPPGVCSLCLKERLVHLTASTSNSRAKSAVAAAECSSSSSVSSISSDYSSASASASSCASPTRPHRFAMEGIKGSSTSIFLFKVRHVLTRSKSVAAVDQGEEDGKGKKPGFWTRFLRPKQPLMHSRTLTIRDTLEQPVDV